MTSENHLHRQATAVGLVYPSPSSDEVLQASPLPRPAESPCSPSSKTTNSNDLQERVSALYKTHRDGIYRFLVGQRLNSTVAQELTQDTFVELFVALEKGTRIESAQHWLYAVAGRVAVDYWRRESRQVQIDFDSETSAAAKFPLSEPTPETQAGNKQRLTRVMAGLRNLPNEQRACIQLRAQGLRYREIAKVLRVSTSTAAEWVLYAIDRLREEVNGRPHRTGTVTAELGQGAVNVRSSGTGRTSEQVLAFRA
ncbi:MAG: sigma-70 family RNA polymerase sigma factor [Acidobacteriaceae bacterium]|nr:sigma-70 family RNA polymerase sigma factor [Acidobacteriaceae bacterium]